MFQRMTEHIEEVLKNMLNHLTPALTNKQKLIALRLEQFRNKDFRAMEYETHKLFANTDNLALRPVSLTSKVCQDLAAQYIRKPLRHFKGLSPAQEQALTRYYKRLKIDAELLNLEQAGVAQQAYLIGFWPELGSNRMQLHSFSAFEIEEIVSVSVLGVKDVRDADRVVLRIPIAAPFDYDYNTVHALLGDHEPYTAKMVFTKDKAYYELPDKARQGVFKDDFSNPFGYIPLVGTRRAIPTAKNQWLPTPAEDLYALEVGTCLGLSDIEQIARAQCHGIRILKGEGARIFGNTNKTKSADNAFTYDTPQVSNRPTIPNDPNDIAVFPGDVTFEIVNGNPRIDLYLSAIQTNLQLFAAYRNLSPEGYKGLTADSKKVDMLSLQEDRQREEVRCRELESDLAELLVDAHNYLIPSPMKLAQPESVEVEFDYVRTQENILQEAQSRSVLFSFGLDSAVETIMRQEKVTKEEAQDLYEERLRAYERHLLALQGSSTPGLDKLQPKASQKAPRNDLEPSEASQQG